MALGRQVGSGTAVSGALGRQVGLVLVARQAERAGRAGQAGRGRHILAQGRPPRAALDAKLVLKRRFQEPLDVKLALERRFRRHLEVKSALERQFLRIFYCFLAIFGSFAEPPSPRKYHACRQKQRFSPLCCELSRWRAVPSNNNENT